MEVKRFTDEKMRKILTSCIAAFERVKSTLEGNSTYALQALNIRVLNFTYVAPILTICHAKITGLAGGPFQLMLRI